MSEEEAVLPLERGGLIISLGQIVERLRAGVHPPRRRVELPANCGTLILPAANVFTG
jgi:hypothetical protein